LFICGGTFSGIDNIIRRRLGKRSIGFTQSLSSHVADDMRTLIPQVISDDILEFGLIPELIGRLPLITALTPLDEAGLMQVLTEPRNAIVKQYQSLFQMENCEIAFTESGLQEIARQALAKGTGARGLRSIIENVMLEAMFELPDQPRGSKFMIDESIVRGERSLFPKMPESKSA